MLKSLFRSMVISLTAMLSLSSCHDTPQWDNDPYGNFDALWTIIDQHYCYFAEKNIDWNSLYDEYRARLRADMNSRELFTLLSELLSNLRDGHTNLSSPFDVYYYRNWWSDYPQNFSQRLVEQYYLNYSWLTASSITYGVLPDNIGYMRIGSFSSGLGEGNLDYALHYLSTCSALIIDIRDNGGGELTNVEKLVSRFITETITGGYIIHKTGPGHDDFSQPYPYYIDPAPKGYQMWGKPVAVLTNRSTFSAANDFTAIMSRLPQVKIVGATTGGGGAMPFNSNLPNGWGIRFSASPLLTADLKSTENGIDPSPGCEVDLDPEFALSGIDTMIEHARSILLSPTP